MMKKRLIFFSLFLLLIVGFLSITSQPIHAQYTTLPTCTLKIKDKTYCVNNLKIKCECTFSRAADDYVCRWTTTSTACNITPTVEVPTTEPPPTNTPTLVPPTPTVTVTPRVYTMKSKILCPTGTVLTRNIRPFYSMWIQGQTAMPWDFFWSYGDYSTSLERETVISSHIANDSVYYGLESDLKVEKKSVVWSPTPTYYLEPVELIPTGVPWASGIMDEPNTIYAGTWFNPYTNMTSWRRDNVVTGTYHVDFVIPTPYDTQWCTTPTPGTDNTTVTPPPGCTLKSKGDANCDNQINMADYDIWACQMLGSATCNQPDEAANFDGINKVNLNDFEIWRRNFYQSLTTPIISEEPTVTIDNLTPTIEPEPTVEPIVNNKCYFCGQDCILAKVKMNCPDVMPPEGATCSFDEETQTCQTDYNANAVTE